METLNMQHNVISILHTIKALTELHLSRDDDKRFRNVQSALRHARRILKKVYKQSERALCVTKRINLALKMDAGKEIRCSRACIQEVWQQSRESLKTRFQLGSVEWIDHIPENFPPIQCNPNDLKEIFSNVAANALEAMDGKGKIIVRAYLGLSKEGAPSASISISDAGPGISGEILPQLFQPFFTTKSDDGNGLGLFLTKVLTHQNGGSISVSSFKDYGTTFLLQFPLAEKEIGSSSK